MKLEESQVKRYEEVVSIRTVERILEANPYVHIGGSVALFLHGIYLQRIHDAGSGDNPIVDFDLCAPFYQPIIPGTGDKIGKGEVKYSSDADYKEVLLYNGRKTDYRIDPLERWEVINYKGFDFRVTPLEIIMEAKFRYAMKGSKKHREDCYEICGKILPKPVSSSETDLPF